MNKRVKFKKKTILIFLFVFIFCFFLIFSSKSYTFSYSIKNVSVTEKYDKKEKVYRFLFQLNEQTFLLPIEHKYIHTKKLIDDLEIKEKDDIVCLVSKSKKVDVYPVCLKENQLVSYHLLKEEGILDESYFKNMEILKDSYNSINMFSLNNKKFFIWNYKGFSVVSSKEKKDIFLFQNDIYTIPLTIQVGDYLLIADYNKKFEFDKFYVISSINYKVRELNLEEKLSFESYFLGVHDEKAYLVDKKNKKEYVIDPKRLSISNITKENQGKIYIGKNFSKVTMNSLVTNEQSFIYSGYKYYEIIDELLYSVVDDFKTLLSTKEVKQIIYSDSNNIYYLVGEELYSYNDYDGEVLVLSNFEWNFNYKNMIYIF